MRRHWNRWNQRERVAFIIAVACVTVIGPALLIGYGYALSTLDYPMWQLVAISAGGLLGEWALLSVSAQYRGIYDRREWWTRPHRAFVAYVADLLGYTVEGTASGRRVHVR